MAGEFPGGLISSLLTARGIEAYIAQVDKIIDDLVSPKDPSQQAYHVVAPSLPGFVFSSGPKHADFGIRNMAAVDHKLMLALGYDKYMAQGGDWGSMIVRILGIDYPDHCVAVHVNMIAAGVPSIWRNPLSLLYLPIWAMMQGEGSLFKRMLWWQKEETGYLEIQGTKPQTLSYALVDSPIGMLAWIRDKVQHLIDDDYVMGEEEIITWAMLYLIPGTAGHAEIYKNAKDPEKLDRFKKEFTDKVMGKDVDFGASIFPKGMSQCDQSKNERGRGLTVTDVFSLPRWWANASVSSNIVFWKEHEKGGHFASVEKPVELVEDIREFTKLINPGRIVGLVKSGKLKK